jgi:hypoxanthine phosphoribosyltransferase
MVNLLFRGSGLPDDPPVNDIIPVLKDTTDLEILIPESDLKKRIRELGKEITGEFRGQDCLVIPVLDGAMLFAADLIREIPIPLRIAPVKASSYGNSTRSCGTVSLPGQFPEGIAGSSILLVDDILDTGATLDLLVRRMVKEGAARVKTCVLLRKESSGGQRADYVGFDVPDRFVIGYGLDLGGYGRNLPHIGCLPEGGIPGITSR